MAKSFGQRTSPAWLLWTGLAAACTAYAVCSVFSWFPVRRVSPYGPSWTQAFLWEALRWNLWLSLGGLIARWDRRFRLHPRAGAAAVAVFPVFHSVLLVTIYFSATSTPFAVVLRYRPFIVLSDFLTGII